MTMTSEIAQSVEICPRHAVSMWDFSREALDSLFGLARHFRVLPSAALKDISTGQVVAILFFQPSTRTRLNFQAAVQRLGASVIGFSDPKTTRAGDFYKETTEDVVAFTSALCDLIVVRHHVTGMSQRLCDYSTVPIINAGDGYNEHPTQALGDIFTMHELLGSLEGKTIGMIGDLRIRSLRTILFGLRHYDVGKYLFLLPPGTAIPKEISELLSKTGAHWEEVEVVDDLIKGADLIETIGVNHPDHSQPKDTEHVQVETPQRFRITRAKLSEVGRSPFILHPGPRTDELNEDVDALPNAKYFFQAQLGMYARMALLATLLSRA